MNRTAVVYQSKYGSTEKYAKWIAETLSCNLFDRETVTVDELRSYDTIIYGGGLYAGGVSGIDLITENFRCFSGKNIVLFTCGLADTSNPINTDHIKMSLRKHFTNEMEEQIKVFHLRGGIDYSKLSFMHKSMHGLKTAGVTINRKMLAEMAVNDTAAFAQLAEMAKKPA